MHPIAVDKNTTRKKASDCCKQKNAQRIAVLFYNIREDFKHFIRWLRSLMYLFSATCKRTSLMRPMLNAAAIVI